tara:strand:+ start:944 stop:1186 length:243 start_codon:yes stop_codon:yes gene_type:complete
MKDSWGRAVKEEQLYHKEEQLEFDFPLYMDATPEQQEEWFQTNLKPWADKSLTIVAFASVMQVISLGMMLLSFYIINLAF